MKEEFICYLWQFGLWEGEICTTNGQKVKQISPGMRNVDSGPDFFNARVLVGDTEWAGNVEIHVNSSDWYLHKHEINKAYDSVVLHVVYNANKEIKSTKGEKIPSVELKKNIPAKMYSLYQEFMESEKSWIACEKEIYKVDTFTTNQFKEKLLIERLESKTKEVEKLLEKTGRDWSQAFFIHLSASLGLKTNQFPFEMLAKSISVYDLSRVKNNKLQIEAILYGQSALLEKSDNSVYVNSLKKEYSYLRKKLKLNPIEIEMWKFMKMRPSGFPTIRISQLADLIHKSTALFSILMDFDKVKDVRKAFEAEASRYWDTHYTFETISPNRKKKLGRMSIDRIIINTVVPFFYVYGSLNMNEKLKDKALKLLLTLSAEKNTIIDKWISLGVVASNSFDTQALLELKKNFCNKKRCLECRVGNYLLILNK
jgi:Protein of unknown function (DUF2851)